MKHFLLLLPLVLVPLKSQVLVDTFAGGKLRSGVPAQEIPLGFINGMTWDTSGGLVFTEASKDVIRRVGPTGIVETIAGTGITGYGGDGGLATKAILHAPANLGYDAAGNLYFVDSQNFRVRRIDTHGIVTTLAGDGIALVDGMDLEGPATTRSINVRPGQGFAVDRTGTIYFSDTTHDLILRVINGKLEIFAGVVDPACTPCSDGDGGPASKAHLSNPGPMAFDSAGNLYVTERLNNAANTFIRRISPNGIITRFAGYGTAADPMNPPVSDGSPALSVVLGSISGLSGDGSGNLYVAHSLGGTGRIRRIAPSGIITTILSGAAGQLASDAAGNIAYPGANTINEISSQGSMTTLAGGSPKSAPDGTPALEAWFLSPNYIAFNHVGELFIAEATTCVVRKITVTGILSTVAGTGKCGPSTPTSPSPFPDLALILGMAFDSQDRLWLAGPFGTIYLVSPDGTISIRHAPYSLVVPIQIVFDAKDRLYATDRGAIVRVLADGTEQRIVTGPQSAGVPPPGSGPYQPLALATDPSGNVYFLAGSDSSVYRINEDGTYSLFYPGVAAGNIFSSRFAVDGAGTVWRGTQFTNASGTRTLGRDDPGYSGDGGPAQSARFSSFAVIWSSIFSSNGDLYLIDGDRVRRLSGLRSQILPTIAPGGIVSSASYSGGAISPGELLSVFGANFGASGLEVASFENNIVPSQLGRTKVLFGDQAGEITAMTPSVINVLVPQTVAAGNTIDVAVQVDATVSARLTIPVVKNAIDLYTKDWSGSGQGIILNEDGSLNSSVHPAPPGSIVSLFGTGEGVLTPQLPKGALVISTPFPVMTDTPGVTIGGQHAEVRYGGAAPFLPLGIFQIDVKIPSGVAPGDEPLSVMLGDRSTTRRVTIAVQ